MTKEEIRDYSMRITQSSKSQLVVITYDIITNYLFSAKVSLENDDKKEFVKNINKAKEFVDNLISSLNMQYKLSYELINIYLFINRCLVEAIAIRKSDKIDRLILIIKKLQLSFEEVSEQDNSGPVIKNTQKVYAGLTYSKGHLNEYLAK